MQVTIATKDLLTAARAAVRIGPPACFRGPDWASGVMLAASGRDLTVQGWRPGMMVEARRPAAVAKTGGALVNGRALVALLAALDAPELTIEAEAGMLRIAASGGVYRLKLIPAAEWPQMPAVTAGPAPTITSSTMKNLMRATAWAMGKGDQIGGMRLEIAGHAVAAVATNGDLLSAAEARLAYAAPAKASGTLPRAAVLEALRAITSGGVTIRIGAQHFRLSAGDWTIAGDMLPGTFPNWRQTVGAHDLTAGMIKVDRATLQKAAKRAGATGRGCEVEITPLHEAIAVTGRGAHGHTDEEIPAVCVSWNWGGVSLPLDRLAPALAALRSADVTIEARDRLSGVVFRDADRPGCLVLAMPKVKREG